MSRLVSTRELRRQFELAKGDREGERAGRAKVRRALFESLERRELRPSDFSVRGLFEACVENGREILDSWSHPKSGWGTELLEAGGTAAVGYGDFSGITGQIFFTEVQDAYDAEDLVFKKEVEAKQSSIQDVERIPNITGLGDRFLTVGENGEYQRIGVGEDYKEVAYKQKRGAIVEVTKEAVFGDKTGMLLEKCQKLGEFLGINIEKRVIDAIIDENAGAASAHQGGHRYTWRGTAYATYQASSPWVNSKTSNGLGDWINVQAAWLQLAAITDPFTGEPIMVQPDCIIVAPDKYWEALRIINATEVRSTAPGFATSATPQQTTTTNPVNMVFKGGLKILSSRLLKARLATDTNWFLANLKKGVRRYYNWDLQTMQRGAGTEAEFNRDVVSQYRADVKDAVAVIEPRVMQKNAA